MAIFPDWLYSFTPRDQQVTPLEILNVSYGGSDNDTFVSAGSYLVPKDKVLIISSVTASLTSDDVANSKPLSWWLRTGKVDMGGGAYSLTGKYFGGNALDNLDYVADSQTHGQIYVPPENYVWGESQFNYDLLGTINYFSIDIHGILIPRGNFAI